MGKLANIWAFIGRHKYWVTIGAFLLIIGVLDENSLIRKLSVTVSSMRRTASC